MVNANQQSNSASSSTVTPLIQKILASISKNNNSISEEFMKEYFPSVLIGDLKEFAQQNGYKVVKKQDRKITHKEIADAIDLYLTNNRSDVVRKYIWGLCHPAVLSSYISFIRLPGILDAYQDTPENLKASYYASAYMVFLETLDYHTTNLQKKSDKAAKDIREKFISILLKRLQGDATKATMQQEFPENISNTKKGEIKLNKQKAKFLAENGREVKDDEELAQYTGLMVETIKKYRDISNAKNFRYLNEEIDDSNGSTTMYGETIACTQPGTIPDEVVIDDERVREFYDKLDVLDDLQKTIILLHYGFICDKPLSSRKIAEKLGMIQPGKSAETARKKVDSIIDSALKKLTPGMKQYIADYGYN